MFGKIGDSRAPLFLRTFIPLVVAGVLQATIVPSVSFHDLVAKADQIVTGRVVGSTVSWGTEHKYIWTRYEIAVSRVVKGEQQKTVIVSEPGGTLDGVTMRIAGAVTYEPGEHVALFLQCFPSGLKRTVGWNQGKVIFDAGGKTLVGAIDRVSGIDEGEFRNRVVREMRSGSSK